jgi:hypothetical protein
MDSNSLRPVAPNLNGLSGAAKESALEKFEESEARYVNHLLAKPSGSLTSEEHKFLLKGVTDWLKRERR